DRRPRVPPPALRPDRRPGAPRHRDDVGVNRSTAGTEILPGKFVQLLGEFAGAAEFVEAPADLDDAEDHHAMPDVIGAAPRITGGSHIAGNGHGDADDDRTHANCQAFVSGTSDLIDPSSALAHYRQVHESADFGELALGHTKLKRLARDV